MSDRRDAYRQFVARKVAIDHGHGFPCTADEVNPLLKDFQRECVAWAVRGGRRALFEAFGLGKSMQQLEVLRLTLQKSGGKRALVVIPLAMRHDFKVDAEKLGLVATFVRTTAEVGEAAIYLTNYESVREGKIDPRVFDAISLDEASILRGLGGTKTFREFMRLFEDTDAFRFVATATPSPNDYIELLAYAAFLGIMDVGQAKTRFFKRNSEKADKLTIHPHKEREFWLWVASWSLFVQKPSDLGFSDEGYDLPPLDIRWHELPSDHSDAGQDHTGQGRLLKNTSLGLSEAAKEKRTSLDTRIAKLLELRAEDPTAHRIVWHDLEAEREAIEKAVPSILSVFGNQDLDIREERIALFSDGFCQELAGKPVMLGSGCNLQRHCHWAIFLGIGHKFNDFIQAIHRLQRFLQTHPVRVDLIYTEAEREIRESLERKWRQHKKQMEIMTGIIRQYGLTSAAMASELTRGMGVDRRVAEGKSWRLANDDSILYTMDMEEDSVHLIGSSFPFSHQYEYSPNYADLGHTDDNDHFWAQMDYLIPEMLRVLKPGRVAAIHVKDRITPGGINGLGFQTVTPFSDECVREMTKHGFAFVGRKTIVTDVVRENAQTYRLGWSEQCKDGSRMGCGMPEYLLIFRKPQSDRTKGYADEPVVKSKDEYSRGRWQFDAHGFMRSSGDRLLTGADLVNLKADEIYQAFKRHSLEDVYDFERDVEIADTLDRAGRLPPSFMLLQPQSWHEDVWADVVRMRTLNTVQAAKSREQHLCPLPLDICERVVVQYSMPGEVVYDPFSGLGSFPFTAVKKGRIGWGCDLSPLYFNDSLYYMRDAERASEVTPTLFDLIDFEEREAA